MSSIWSVDLGLSEIRILVLGTRGPISAYKATPRVGFTYTKQKKLKKDVFHRFNQEVTSKFQS